MQDILKIKITAGVSLWVISLIFGILLPFLIWRSSSKWYRQRKSNRARSVHMTNSETINLIPDDDFVAKKSCCYGLRNVTRRFLSWLKVRFGKGWGLSLANCVCGGIFLGVCLLDLIPQSRQDVDEILKTMNITTTFPVSEFAISIGLLLIMTTENLAMQFCLPHKHKSKPKNVTKVASNAVIETTSDTEILIEDSNISPPAKEVAVYRNYILAATLSLHSIFEGLAIGLQRDLPSLIEMFIAISVHKAVLTFGIGIRLFETLGECGRVRAAAICAFIFCTASPVGCAIGASVSSYASLDEAGEVDSSQIASALLQSLATGTFLYVTFVEVIPNEFSHSDEHEHEEKVEPVAVRSEQQVSPVSSAPSTSINSESPVSLTDPEKEIKEIKVELPRLFKLLSLLFGFAIASGLQCV